METPRYAIHIDVDSDAGRFRGEVRLALAVEGPDLTLHSVGLRIERLRVDGTDHPFELKPAEETLVLRGVARGEHMVSIEYAGTILAKGLIGFYRSPYGPRSLVTSMMYPNGARRCFPCLDEPSAKAVFEVALTVGRDEEVVFNTPAVSSEVSGARKLVRFAPTPKMSTYVMYIGVGPMSFRSRTANGVEVIAAVPAGREAASDFALDHAGRVLAGFAQYFEIPYPLPKLHLVSIPDFWAGAMENWGAIAFHETRMLVEPTTPAGLRRRVRETITHEVAHQWFGNLVTMQWWNDFWLNESFATFMQAKLDQSLQPELDMWSDFLLTFPSWGFGGDVLRSTHPIEVAVQAPTELAQIADEVTYGKGSAVLAMIEQYLGETAFRDGVRQYLRQFAYGNARSADLWRALGAAASQPVERIMSEWVRRPGHPVVIVRRDGDRIVFEQRRFLLDGTRTDDLWPIPLLFELGGTSHRVLLDSRSMSIPAGEADGLLVNPRRSGFYRVRYDGPLRESILARYPQLTEWDRWALVLDTYAFVLSGDLPLSGMIELLAVAARAPAPLTVGECSEASGELGPFLPSLPTLQEAFRRYFEEAYAAVATVPPGKESEQLGAMRATLAHGRVRTDLEFARQQAREFGRLDELSPELQGATVAAYARVAGPAEVEELARRMFAAPSEEVARRMMNGLVMVRGEANLRRVLEFALDPRMPASRTWAFLLALVGSDAAPAATWAWMADHLREVEKLLGGTPLLSRLLEATIARLGTRFPDQVRAYFAANQFPEGNRGATKGLERIGILRAFLERNGVDLTTLSLPAA